MFLRVKFFTSRPYDTSTYDVLWELGPVQSPQRMRRQMDISPEAPIEFEIPPNLLDTEGNLIVELTNGSQTPLFFSLQDGMGGSLWPRWLRMELYPGNGGDFMLDSFYRCYWVGCI